MNMLARQTALARAAHRCAQHRAGMCLAVCWVAATLVATLASRAAGAPTELRCGAQRASVEIDPAITGTRRAALARWVRYSLDSVGQIYGAWPQDRIHFSLRSLDASRFGPLGGFGEPGAVPWGQVTRGDAAGEPATVLLVVNPTASMDAITRDWVAYHEISHLLLPYRVGARWFVEGLATYYQNVVQARVGLLSETQMWQKMHEGLERGLADDRWSEDPLWQVDEDVGRRRAYLRVYWSGVRYWMGLDVALRRAGHHTLDGVLLALRQCCRDQRLRAWHIAQRLDALSQTRWFTQRFDQYIKSRAVPAYGQLFGALGVRVDASGRLTLVADAPDSALRAGIAARRFRDFADKACTMDAARQR